MFKKMELFPDFIHDFYINIPKHDFSTHKHTHLPEEFHPFWHPFPCFMKNFKSVATYYTAQMRKIYVIRILILLAQ